MKIRGFLSLARQFTFRPLLYHRLRSFLTVSGVALGLGVVGAVHLSTERAVGSFSQSLQLLEGGSDFHVTGSGYPLSESWLEKFNWFWEFGSMSPRVEAIARTEGKREIRIYGVDLVGDPEVREYFGTSRQLSQFETSPRRLGAQAFLGLLAGDLQILVPEILARQEGLELGSRWNLTIGSHTWEFQVGAILSDGGIGSAFGGNLAIMDIATAQDVLGKKGLVDRIDFKLDDPGAGAVIQRVEQQSRERLVFHRKGDLAEQGRKMLGSFQLNLRILSYLALIVGVILIWNTVGLSAISRRWEIATLRTLGTSRRVVFSLFLAEAFCLGCLGATGGVIVAPYLASLADLMVSRTVAEFYAGSSIGATQTRLELDVLILLLCAGVSVALASGSRPAWSTTRVAPVEVLREGSWSITSRTQLHGLSLTGIAAFVLASLLSLGPPLNGIPILGYVACFLYILAFSLGALPAMRLILAAARKFVWTRDFHQGLLGVESRLALQQLQGNTSRVSLAVVSLMIAVAMFVGVATMVGSFRSTVQTWINQTFVADLFIHGAGGSAAEWTSPLKPETISQIEKIPGVDAVGTFRGASIEWKDIPITLAGAEFSVLRDYGKLLFMESRPGSEILESARAGKRVIVSEPFSRRFVLARGDRIDLKTPSGIHSLEIEAVYQDYSSDRGVVVMDRSLFGHLFGDRSANTLAIYVDPKVDADSVSQRIRSALPDLKLVIQPNSELRASALKVFDRTFSITYGVELIALIVAALGVTNTLAGLILERQGEFALLRFLGAFPKQVRRITLAEATLLGLVGCLLGSVLGQILALVLIYVINLQSFGWTIQFDLPLVFVTGGLVLISLVTVLAGIYPALLSSRMDALRALRAG